MMKFRAAILSLLLMHGYAYSALTIDTQPVGLTTVIEGTLITLQVSASTDIVPAPTLLYQWFKNGASLAASSASNQLVIASAKASDTGSYVVKIVESGVVGAVTLDSAQAHVVVNVRPKITVQPKAPTAAVDNAQSASLSVTLDSGALTRGTPPFTYTWQRKNGTLWSDLVRNSNSLAYTDTFTLPAVQFADAGSYRVVVQNAAGSVTSSETILKVNSPPVLVGVPGKIVTLFQTNGGTAVVEGGATDTYSVVLSAPPSTGANVTVTPAVTSPFFTDSTPTSSAEVAITPANVVFTQLNWNVPQTFTVTANNDTVANAFLEGAAPLNVRNVVVSHSVASTDTGYNLAQVSNFLCSITDNETAPRIVVTENSAASSLPGTNGVAVVTEGGATDSFTVAFAGAAAPTADVIVTLNVGARLTASPATLTFTNLNYATPQTVTLSAVNDAIFQGLQYVPVTFSTASTDATYAGLAAPTLNVRINDNDEAGAQGITVKATGGDTRVVEGGMNDEIYIVLNKAPTSDVILTRIGGAPGAGAAPDLASPGNLIFTTANWFIPQRLLVAATDDLLVEPTRNLLFNYTLAGGGYAGPVPGPDGPISVRVGDNDVNTTVGVRVVQSGTTDVTEGGATDSISIVLAGAPTANVTVTLAVSPATQVALSGATLVANTLTFTPANWNSAQVITLTANDDTVTEGLHTAALSFSLGNQTDTRYSGLVIADVPINITDNDNGARVILTQSGGTTIVTEGGATDFFTVALAGPVAPVGNVTLTLAGGSQLNVPSPATLTFNNLNWKVPQTVVISAANDTLSEGPHSGGISFSSAAADLNFNALSVTPLPVSIIDNDSGGALGMIEITETDDRTALVEGGEADSIFLCLRRQPTANVTLTPTLSSPADVTLSVQPPLVLPLVFTPANWNVPQMVSLAAVIDVANEGIETVTLFFTPTNTGGYAALDVSESIDILIGDKSAGSKNLVITESGAPAGTSVTENGPTAGNGSPNSKDVYTISLSQAPSADVTVTPVASVPGQISFTPASLTFTAANFATAQTITVSALANTVSEPLEVVDVDHVVNSTDLGYNSIPVDPLEVSVTDDDSGMGRIIITETDGQTVLREDVGSDTIQVSLIGPAPASNVTVNLSRLSSQFQFFVNGAPVTSTSLIFTPANHTVPQTVALVGLDDAVLEGTHSDTVLATTAPGSQIEYRDIFASLPFAILDNESAARTLISVIETSASTRVIEGGIKDTFSLALLRAPTANVVLTPVFNTAQIGLSVRNLTFTTLNWNIPQVVTVTATDDTLLEGTHSSAIIYSAGNTGGYLLTDTASVNVQIGDNEGLAPALPAFLNIAQGATGTLKVSPAGSTPFTQYRWYKDGNALSAKTASLSIKGLDAAPGTEAAGPGIYHVEIDNGFGTVSSNFTTVRVIRKPTIKVDLSAKLDRTLPAGAGPVTLEVELNTLNDFGTFTYQWQKDGKNIGPAVILPPAADPRTIAITSSTPEKSALSFTPVSWLDRGAYKVIISNEVGSVTSKTTTIGITAPPVIITQPANVTGPTGGSAKFTVVAGGTPALTYQWQFSTLIGGPFNDIATGKAASLTVSKLSATASPPSQGFYRCRVTGPATLGSPFIFSDAAFLQVDNPPAVTPPLSVQRITSNASMAAGSALVQFTNPTSAALCKIGQSVIHPALIAPNVTITAVDTVNNTITLSTTNTTGLPLVIDASNPMDIVGAGKLVILSGTNIHLKVTAGGTNTPANPLIYSWQKNGTEIFGSPNSDTLILPTTSTADSGTYTCTVKNLVGSVRSAGLAIKVETAPTITAQSNVVTAVEESMLEFSVTVVGSPTLKYSWQKESLTPGVYDPPLAGKTTNKLTFPKVSLDDRGKYICTITNAVGQTVSAQMTADVTPIPPPTIGNSTVSLDQFYPPIAIAGEKVRLHGSNLAFTREVFIGGVKATFVIESDTSILITVPDTAPLTASVIQVKTKNVVPANSTQLFTRDTDYTNNGPLYTTAASSAVLGLLAPSNMTLLTGNLFTQKGNSEFAGGQGLFSSVFYHWRVPVPSACTIQIQADQRFDCALVVYKQRTTETLNSATRYGPDKITRFKTNAEPTSTNNTGSNFEKTLNPIITTIPNQELIIVVQSNNPYAFGMNTFGGFSLTGRAQALPPNSPFLQSSGSSSTSALSPVTSKTWSASSDIKAVSLSTNSDGGTSVQFGGIEAKGAKPIEIWSNDGPATATDSAVVSSFTMRLEPGAEDGDDQFAWQASDPQGQALLALWVNASDGSIRAVEPNGKTHTSIQHITPGGGAHRFEITVDPVAATWITVMDGVPVTAPIPLPAGARFGDISAVWDLGADQHSSGASIIFDDFRVEAQQAP